MRAERRARRARSKDFLRQQPFFLGRIALSRGRTRTSRADHRARCPRSFARIEMMSALISVNCPRGLGAGLPPRLRAPSSSSSRASRGTSASGRPSKYPRVGPPRRRLDPDTTLRFYAAVAARERAEARAAAARGGCRARATRTRTRTASCARSSASARISPTARSCSASSRRSSSNPPTRTRTPKRPNASRDMVSPTSTSPTRTPQRREATKSCARWGMTVAFIASTASVERAAMYVLSTPFRAGFWAVAHALRLTFWACTGRLWNRGRRLGVVGYTLSPSGESPWDRPEMKEPDGGAKERVPGG